MKWCMDSFENIDDLLSANLPRAAFRLDGLQDQRLKEAALQAATTGKASPLLKEELRTRILKRRHEEGKPEIQTSHSPPPQYQLTPAEKEKKERRKEQNRRAAKKCREKKKREQTSIGNKYETTREKNSRLKQEVEVLRKCQSSLQTLLFTHMAVCNLRIPSSRIGQQQQQQQQPLHHWQPQQQQQQQQISTSSATVDSQQPTEATVTNATSDVASIPDLETQSLVLNSTNMEEAMKSLTSTDLKDLIAFKDDGTLGLKTEQKPEQSTQPVSLPPAATPMETINPADLDLPGYPWGRRQTGKQARHAPPTPVSAHHLLHLPPCSTPKPTSPGVPSRSSTPSVCGDRIPSFLSGCSTRRLSATPPPPSPGLSQRVPGTAQPTPSTSPAPSFFDDHGIASSLSACMGGSAIPQFECLSGGLPELAFDDLLSSSQED